MWSRYFIVFCFGNDNLRLLTITDARTTIDYTLINNRIADMANWVTMEKLALIMTNVFMVENLLGKDSVLLYFFLWSIKKI